MAFDQDTEYKLVLDKDEGGVSFSQDLEYIIDLAQRVSGPATKDFVALSGGFGNTENNIQSGITNFKERNPQITFTAYFSKRDKSDQSFHNAVNNGDFVLNDLIRFKKFDIVDADTTNDEVTVSGDMRERTESGSTIVIDGSTGNDEIYTVDSVSYDAGYDNTTLGLVQSLPDSTADGKLSDGVKTVVEQKVWLEEFVFDGRIGEEYDLRGQEFQDETITGRRVVVNQASIERNSKSIFSGTGTLKTKEGFNVG